MHEISWDRLLETVVRRDAYEVVLAIGAQPIVKFVDEWRALQVAALTADEFERLSSDPRVPAVEETYGLSTGWFDYQDRARFKMTVAGSPKRSLIVLHRLPLDRGITLR